jgi:hypothetical protein
MIFPELEKRLEREYNIGTNMKTFNTDKPILRYFLLGFGFAIGTFTGTVAATLLYGVLFNK